MYCVFLIYLVANFYKSHERLIMSSIIYFSYGSNMSTPRLVQRIPSARFVSVASLRGHKLKFHKRGHDRSAKCDIEFTDRASDFVYGIVFKYLASEKPNLDLIEGLGNGYNEKVVTVMSLSGREYQSVTYFATDIDKSLKPFHWYKEHVVRGAVEHGLPVDYIRTIESIVSVPDPDQINHQRELAIYN